MVSTQTYYGSDKLEKLLLLVLKSEKHFIINQYSINPYLLIMIVLEYTKLLYKSITEITYSYIFFVPLLKIMLNGNKFGK